MKVGQTIFRVSISLNKDDYEVLRILAREHKGYMKHTTLACNVLLEYLREKERKSEGCINYRKNMGKQYDLFDAKAVKGKKAK